EQIDEQTAGGRAVRVRGGGGFLERNRLREPALGECVVNRHAPSIPGGSPEESAGQRVRGAARAPAIPADCVPGGASFAHLSASFTDDYCISTEDRRP